MFSPHQASGFVFTPVTKGLLGGLVLTSVAFNIPLSSYRHWFSFTFSTLFENVDVLHYLSCRAVFLDPKDLICASVLLYNFRIFERRYGSRKFASFLVAAFLLSSALEMLALYACHLLDFSVDPMPSGPYGMVFSLFIPYFCDIPRVAMTTILGIPVTGKSLTYIIGLQMASGSPESFLLSLCGVIAGIIFKQNVLKLQSLVWIPNFVGKIFSQTVGRLLDTGLPNEPFTPMGATLEIQRLQQMEQLEQQMAWAQLQRPQPRNLPGFGGIFGNRNAVNANPPAPPPEEQVQRLVEMGFNRDRVLHALSVTNNDVNLATNILLQEL